MDSQVTDNCLEITGHDDIFLQDAYIAGTNLMLVFKNVGAASAALACSVHYEARLF